MRLTRLAMQAIKTEFVQGAVDCLQMSVYRTLQTQALRQHVCSASIFRHRSTPPLQAHHRPQFRDHGLYSRLWCGRAEAELLEDFRFSYRSELPWSYAVNACHKRMRPSQSFGGTYLTVLRTWSLKVYPRREVVEAAPQLRTIGVN